MFYDPIKSQSFSEFVSLDCVLHNVSFSVFLFLSDTRRLKEVRADYFPSLTLLRMLNSFLVAGLC